MADKFDTLLKRPIETAPSGKISIIRAIPDVFTGEMLNIGVLVTDDKGRRSVRVIDAPGRLECLYGDAADNLVQLAKFAGKAFLEGEEQPSPNIVIAEARPFYNMSAEDALAQFFLDQVTVAIPQRQPAERAEPVKTEKMRAEVYQLLRVKGRFMSVDALIPQSPLTIVQTEKGPRTVRVPLQAADALAGLESADYSGPTIRMHLMDTILDIECAATAKEFKKLGLFIGRPTRKMSEQQLRDIDNAIDYVIWRVPKHCRVEVEQDLAVLADKILDWADLKAA